MANNHDIPELMPIPEQLHVFDVYRMRVRFEDDPTKSRNHYVAAIVIQADDDGGVAVELTGNPTWHRAGDVQLPEYEHAGLTHLTTARCAQLVRFLRSDLQGFTGRLSRNDAIRVANAVGEVKPEEQLWL